jgi:signal peptidase I
MKKLVREYLIIIALVALFYLLFHLFVQNSQVYDVSMQPTLLAGQRMIILKVGYTPERGDIVIVKPPMEQKREYVKRLIGLPGDTIRVKDNTVYLNGIDLDEPYINEKPEYSFGPYTVPEGHYFLLGDNRNHSNDSHTGWTVTRQEIVGKAWLRYWPFDKWGSPGNYDLNEQIDGSGAEPALSGAQ